MTQGEQRPRIQVGLYVSYNAYIGLVNIDPFQINCDDLKPFEYQVQHLDLVVILPAGALAPTGARHSTDYLYKLEMCSS